MKFIDLRSDTVTEPTEAMRKAMYEATVGDDVYGDDETTVKLEKYAAELVGKEAALFVPSGTFGNQLSLLTHCRQGNEVILGNDCHIVCHEVGAASVIAGVQLRTLKSNNGELSPKEIEATIRKEEDIHYPDTALICLENSHSNGSVISLENMAEIRKVADKYNLPIHLDGARLFNAAAYLDVDVKEITKNVDTVMFCLSKGLCAPVGSILAGSKAFIDRARKYRKLMGGGLRQCGVITAAGLVALKDMRDNLKVDHEKAVYLAKKLTEIPGIKVMEDNLHINMVFFELPSSVNSTGLVNHLLEKGIKICDVEDGLMRFVTHYWISYKDIDFVIDTMKDYLNI
ncbi:MAG: low-specificity L-threonine aldolase [Clostridium sp.]